MDNPVSAIKSGFSVRLVLQFAAIFFLFNLGLGLLGLVAPNIVGTIQSILYNPLGFFSGLKKSS